MCQFKELCLWAGEEPNTFLCSICSANRQEVSFVVIPARSVFLKGGGHLINLTFHRGIETIRDKIFTGADGSGIIQKSRGVQTFAFEGRITKGPLSNSSSF